MMFYLRASVILCISMTTSEGGFCITRIREGQLVSEGDCGEPLSTALQQFDEKLKARELGSSLKSNCSAISLEGNGQSGVFNISYNGKHFEVYCDSTTDGGGWTVFQRRIDGSVDFYRTWEEYANGFGNKSGEFWLGLENIYQLTQDGAYELRIELTDWDGRTAYAKYEAFSISGRSDNYTLAVGNYSGTAGDSLTYSSGAKFSAKDKDYSSGGTNCAVDRVAAWWYKNCAYATLNGRYSDTSGVERGIH